jgi:sec-independent protein translocase protein TatA
LFVSGGETLIGAKIGIWEILLVLAVALIIFGPAKLPELGRSIGKGLKEFRKATRELKDTINLDESDIDLDDKKS